jgi:hypothetical protein
MFSKPMTPPNGINENAVKGQRTTEMPGAQWCDVQQITKQSKHADIDIPVEDAQEM